jgi:hypothetical protein
VPDGEALEHLTVSSALIERSTSIASTSRVNSSTTFKNFSSRPSSVVSCW